MSVLAALTLPLLLTSCARDPVIEYRTEYVYPPSVLLQPNPVPEYRGTDWGDIPEHCAEVQRVLSDCNADKTALRQWAGDDDKEDNR